MRTVPNGGEVAGRAGSAATLRPERAWIYAVIVVGCGVLALANINPAVTSLASLVVVVGTLVAIEVGIRRNRPARRAPWRHLQVAVVTAALAAALRTGTDSVAPGATPLADAVALVAYALLGVWLVKLLRARRGRGTEGAVADGLLVGIAAFLLVWVLLISPTLAADGVPLWARVLAGGFPVIDAVLIFIVVRLSFVLPSSLPASWLIMATLLGTLVGDLGYAVGAAGVLSTDPRVLDGIYVFVYGLVGVTALHPSMRMITEPAPDLVSPLPRGRLALVSLSLTAPAALVLTQPMSRPTDRAIVAGGILVLGGVVLWRTVRAVNQHAASEARLAHLATHDPLTGLPNRVRLLANLGEALARAASDRRRSVCVLFLDLDGFKLVNDSWGHSVGDELLLAVGRRLRAAEQPAGLVTRVGGDEFVLVEEGEDALVRAPILAQSLLEQLRDPFVLSIGEVFVTASIGIAHTANGLLHRTPDDLIRDADTAMYRAKGEGRNRWALFDEDMRDAVRNRLRMEVALRRALERREFRVHYQPIVRLSDALVLGYEALVRWESPERGLVSPNEFIPVIEDTDLIVEVGALVLRRAAEQLVRWREERPDGENLYMSVNVAARQLRDPAFVDDVSRVLADTGLPPTALCLEITESAMVEDSDATRTKLGALRELGIGLSVDDFGTGYSSLRYLKTFPVTTVKIDRAFVDGLGTDPDDEVIVQAVLAMSVALGLSVIAEGVETSRQRDRLRALGCTAAQGYLYGKPQPAARSNPDGSEPAPAVSEKVIA